MCIEDKYMFPVAEAQYLQAAGILSVKMRAEVQTTNLCSESQQLTAGHLDGLLLEGEKKTAPGVALVAFKMIGFVE